MESRNDEGWRYLSCSCWQKRNVPWEFSGGRAVRTLGFQCNWLVPSGSVVSDCDPTDCGSPGSSVHGIFQASILEWVAISSSGDPPDPGIEPASPALQMDSLPLSPWGSLHCRGFGFDPWLGHHPVFRSHCCLQWALFPQRYCSWSPLPWAPVWSGCFTQWSSWGCLPSSSWMPWLPPYWLSPLFSFYLPHVAVQRQCWEVNFFLHIWYCPYWMIFGLLFGGVSSIKVILLQRLKPLSHHFWHSVLQRSLVDSNPPSF